MTNHYFSLFQGSPVSMTVCYSFMLTMAAIIGRHIHILHHLQLVTKRSRRNTPKSYLLYPRPYKSICTTHRPLPRFQPLLKTLLPETTILNHSYLMNDNTKDPMPTKYKLSTRMYCFFTFYTHPGQFAN